MKSSRTRLFLTAFSILSLISLVIFFYLPYLPTAIIPYVWMGWFLPIEGIILLLVVGCVFLILFGCSFFLKDQVGSFAESLADYWWVGMRVYTGFSWIIISLVVWTREFITYDFTRMVNLMGSEGLWPWYNSFLIGLVLPNAQLFAQIIFYTQLLIGLCLMLGFLSNLASAIGIFLNINFLIAISWADSTGTVAAQNFFMIFQQISFLAISAGRLLGLDEYLSKKHPRVLLW